MTAAQPLAFRTRVNRRFLLPLLPVFYLVLAVPVLGLELRIPIACEVGRSCEIQTYVDRDPGSGTQDYTCGSTTYDKHNGVDFRVPTLTAQRAGVAVLADADGRVVRRRDGVEDVSVREKGPASVAGEECGNGIVIDHGDGWETQYCHMAKGSLRVRPGDQVKAGDPIGSVGLSGLTEYPHLHFTVRSNKKVVDPFAVGSETCGAGQSLWTLSAQAALSYRTHIVLNTGFSTVPVTNEMIEGGDLEGTSLSPQSPALVAYVRVINAKAGDVQKLVLRGPEGSVVAENIGTPLSGNKAQAMMFTGRKVRDGGWPRGFYEATYTVMKDNKVITEKIFRTEVK